MPPWHKACEMEYKPSHACVMRTLRTTHNRFKGIIAQALLMNSTDAAHFLARNTYIKMLVAQGATTMYALQHLLAESKMNIVLGCLEHQFTMAFEANSDMNDEERLLLIVRIVDSFTGLCEKCTAQHPKVHFGESYRTCRRCHHLGGQECKGRVYGGMSYIDICLRMGGEFTRLLLQPKHCTGWMAFPWHHRANPHVEPEFFMPSPVRAMGRYTFEDLDGNYYVLNDYLDYCTECGRPDMTHHYDEHRINLGIMFNRLPLQKWRRLTQELYERQPLRR